MCFVSAAWASERQPTSTLVNRRGDDDDGDDVSADLRVVSVMCSCDSHSEELIGNVRLQDL